MKAIEATKYGQPEVLRMVEIEKPIPKDDEVLVKVHATTVHIGDTKIRGLKPGMGKIKDIFYKPLIRVMLGFTGPRSKILGMELAGEVEQVGKSVTMFKKGDQIFAATGMKFGAYAEYAVLPEDGAIALKPSNMTYEQAAPVSNGAITALLVLQKVGIKSGQKVMIYGASGSVGTYAVQIAKALGTEVTGVCSTTNIEMVKSLGADRVIDYTKEDFVTLGQKYDIFFDAVGKADKQKAKSVIRKNGKYANVLTTSDGIEINKESLLYLKSLIEKGELVSVIDKTYSLEQIVEAHRYVEQGHKKGNVIVKVNN